MSTAPTTEAQRLPDEEPKLKADAIGFVDGVSIGLASTSPAYSLAAIAGLLVGAAAFQAPAVLLTAFVPMALIATAFMYLSRADPDAGTTYSWVTKAAGPWVGWFAGWAVTITGILVIGSLAEVAVIYGLTLLGLDELAGSRLWVVVISVVVIVVMGWLCVQGTELSAKLQNLLVLVQTGILILFAVVVLVKVFGGSGPEGSVKPTLDWLNPFAIPSTGALTAGLLLSVFAYWGWESTVNLSEEMRGDTSTAGKAAVTATALLLVTYVLVMVAMLAWSGPGLADAQDESIIGTIASSTFEGTLGTGFGKLVIFAVVTSALASTQTTILPASRTVFSMGRSGAAPAALGRIDPRRLTPKASTWFVSAVAVVWYIAVSAISTNALYDSITAMTLAIAFYYAITGLACPVFLRRFVFRSPKLIVFAAVGPVFGAVVLLYLLGRQAIDLTDPANSESGIDVLGTGLGLPFVMAVVIAVAGLVLMVIWRFAGPESYWAQRPVAASSAIHERVDAAPAAARPEVVA